MSRFPLEPLSRVRSVRLRCALARVSACRLALDEAVGARDDIAQRLHAARRHRRGYREGWAREMAGDAHDAGWAGRHERHLALLDASIVEVQGQLAEADEDIARARAELDDALAAWRRVQSKCDALQSLRSEWECAQRAGQERREERAVEELRLLRDLA